MSIEFARSYKTSDGVCHSTVEQAQRHALHSILAECKDSQGALSAGMVVDSMLRKRLEVINVLTITESSRPKARAVNGGRKPRKNRVTEPVQTTSA